MKKLIEIDFPREGYANEPINLSSVSNEICLKTDDNLRN